MILETHGLLAKNSADALLRHATKQHLHRLHAQTLTRRVGGVKERQLKPLTQLFPAQPSIQTEQHLKHRPAAHRTLLLRIGGET
ncbi:hypothetical protein GALL_452030 [mine drainage metagenome]|uniref:Uncharacterized protein n=1 Tax=mine drainage metagenome TaxID=410659 RepID=A0A1J5PQU1_9ZZZZ